MSTNYIYWVGGSTPATENIWKVESTVIESSPGVDVDAPYGGVDNINRAIDGIAKGARLATDSEVDAGATENGHTGKLGITADACSRYNTPGSSSFDIGAGSCGTQEDAGLWVWSSRRVKQSEVNALRAKMRNTLVVVGQIEEDVAPSGGLAVGDTQSYSTIRYIIAALIIAALIYIFIQRK
jgi:hypothetical protein